MHYFIVGLFEWRHDNGLVEKRYERKGVQKDGLLSR